MITGMSCNIAQLWFCEAVTAKIAKPVAVAMEVAMEVALRRQALTCPCKSAATKGRNVSLARTAEYGPMAFVVRFLAVAGIAERRRDCQRCLRKYRFELG